MQRLDKDRDRETMTKNSHERIELLSNDVVHSFHDHALAIFTSRVQSNKLYNTCIRT